MIIEFARKTVVTVDKRTKVVADGQTMATCRLMCPSVLSREYTPTQSNTIAIQLRGCIRHLGTHTPHTCLMSEAEPVPVDGVSLIFLPGAFQMLLLAVEVSVVIGKRPVFRFAVQTVHNTLSLALLAGVGGDYALNFQVLEMPENRLVVGSEIARDLT